ncbi:MAG: DbpA RNA binding domain-containing protein [Treponema sp.]|nr:DbpA RNA binding domain-containing protein [Treponema sp.]
MDQYRKLIKKEVSFFKRSYFAAYLLMELDQRGGGKYYGAAGRDGRLSRGNQAYGSRKYGNGAGAAGEGQKGERPEYPLPEEESVKLFFSVGRSRKVFPREILGLIISRTSTAKEDVGAIRILDNYSFVQVRNTAADDIIGNLNGSMFRGRPLTVNFARTKKDAEAASGGEDPWDGGSGITDQGRPGYESGGDSADDAFPEYGSGDPGDSSAGLSDENEDGNTKSV